MCSALGARPARLAVRALAPRRAVAEALVRLPPAPPTATLGALRLAALGAAGAGKSTLVGVLTHGELDSGAGSARLNVFRHLHEVRSGRTSSLSHEILGFDEEGNVVNYGCAELMTAARIGERSAKLVSFLDLAGHAKYQRTTLHGLAGYAPHYAMIVISSTGGIGPMTEEHLSLALALRLPFFVVLSKADRAPAAAAALLRRLALLLAPAALKPILITNENMAREFASPQKLILDTMDTLNGEQNCQQNNHDRSSGCSELSPVAVFPVSCVRGSGLGPLHAYLLGLQPPRAQWAQLGPGLSGPPEGTADDDESCEFQIDEVFRMEEGSGSGGSEGPVVCGLVVRGELREGAEVLVGPRADGRFGRAAVRTVHAHRVPRASARAGHCVGVALDRRARALRPGMVLLSIPKDYKHDEHSRPVFGACPPGQCPYSHELVTKLMNDNQNDKLKNRKNVRRKNMNLLQDIAAVETSLAKESSGVDKNNIYNRSDSEGEGKTVDDEEEEGAKGAESRCPCGVPLDDPRDPRGALYFQAWVQVLRQPTAVRAGYQCVVHSGGVTQTALVQGVLTARGALRSGEAGSVVLRFVRGPEYLVRGRRALFTAGLGTWAIGHITQVFPYIP